MNIAYFSALVPESYFSLQQFIYPHKYVKTYFSLSIPNYTTVYDKKTVQPKIFFIWQMYFVPVIFEPNYITYYKALEIELIDKALRYRILKYLLMLQAPLLPA